MYKIWCAILPSLLLNTAGLLFAQGAHHRVGGHGLWPDSLETVTVNGTVIIDSTLLHPVYFLDNDGDGNADYHLSFGPWWYEPESGATRPGDGEAVTFVGFAQDHMVPRTLVVFEINELTWREAVAYGTEGWNGHHFWDNRGDTLTATGMILLDTTYFYHHYFLDVDHDSIPEYKLGFGPPWYEPESGTPRPGDGKTVSIFGRVHARPGADMLVVYEVNGQEWQLSDQPAPWAGMWMYRDHSDTTFAYCVNDSSNRIGFPPGHMGGHMGGGMFPDSSFVQFWQIHADSLPGEHDDQHFMGFYLNMHDPSGNTMMDGRFGGHHGGMRLQREQHFQFRYHDEDLERLGLSEDGMMVHYWDAENRLWSPAPGMTVNSGTNTVTFSSEDLSNYYVLAAPSSATGITISQTKAIPADFVLQQNYPNPFNPTTTIQFRIPEARHVKLAVYNGVGEIVATLVDQDLTAGFHKVNFKSNGYSTGVYYYRIEAGGFEQVKKMTLMK
jgi:hypothetical protein